MTVVVVEQAQLIDADYKLAFRIDVQGTDRARSSILGTREPRRCRLCQRGAPEARFSKEAHVIPQSLGNRRWLTWEECDDCNEWAGTELEDHLAKFLSPLRAALALPASSTTVAHRVAKDGARLDADVQNRVVFGRKEHDDPFIKMDLDEETKTLHFSVQTQPLRLPRVARSLGLMAYRAASPTLAKRLRFLVPWIRGAPVFDAHLATVFRPEAETTAPSLGLFLLRRPLIGMPAGLIIFQYGCTWLGWHLPTLAGGSPSRRPFPLIPYSGVAPYAPQLNLLLVGSDQPGSVTMDFDIQFEQMIEGIPAA